MSLFRGIVTVVNDPNQRGRVKAKIPELFLDPDTGDVIDSPWCEMKGGMGQNMGMFSVPPIGAPIWVQARASDDGLYQLIYEPGNVGTSKTRESMAPPTARDKDDETVRPPKGSGSRGVPTTTGTTASWGSKKAMPGSPNASGYPNNKVIKTRGGFVIELDDTDDAERLQIWHPSGAYWEVNAKGVSTCRQVADWRETETDKFEHVVGNVEHTIDGGLRLGVGQNFEQVVRGEQVINAKRLTAAARLSMLFEAKTAFDVISGAASFKHAGHRTASVLGDDTTTVIGSKAETTFGDATYLIAGTAKWVFVNGGNPVVLSTGLVAGGSTGLVVGPGVNAAAPAGMSLITAALVPVITALANHTHVIMETAVPPEPPKPTEDYFNIPDPISVGALAAALPTLTTKYFGAL